MERKNQWVRIIKALKQETGRHWFTTQEIAQKARELYKQNKLPECNRGNGLFKTNYVSAALRRMALRPQNPQIQRLGDEDSNYPNRYMWSIDFKPQSPKP